MVAKATLFRPISMWLCFGTPSGKHAPTALGSRLDWEPMAGSLDWSVVNGVDDFQVQARYAAYKETRKKSAHAAYNGRRDYRRIPDGRQYEYTICSVRRGNGDHQVHIRYKDGKTSDRIVPASEVIRTVRLFISTQYIRHGLDMRAYTNITEDAALMFITPVTG